MSIENLDTVFQPKSIAVVGASERKGSVGAAVMQNLLPVLQTKCLLPGKWHLSPKVVQFAQRFWIF